MIDDPDTCSRPPLGRTVGVALWWLAVVLIGPPAATVTSGLAAGLDGTCYPGPTRLSSVSASWFLGAAAITATVIATLWVGARLLARPASDPTAGVRMLRAHAAVVAVLAAAYLAAAIATRVEDSGGVGGALLLDVGGMPLLDLGLPWSLTHMLGLGLPGAWAAVADPVTTVVPAMLNVAANAALRRAWRHRSRRSRASTVA